MKFWTIKSNFLKSNGRPALEVYYLIDLGSWRFCFFPSCSCFSYCFLNCLTMLSLLFEKSFLKRLLQHFHVQRHISQRRIGSRPSILFILKPFDQLLPAALRNRRHQVQCRSKLFLEMGWATQWKCFAMSNFPKRFCQDISKL